MLLKTSTFLPLLLCAAAVQAQPQLPGVDPIKAAVSHAGGMGLDDTSGKLDIWTFEASSVLSPPVSPLDSLTILPVLKYQSTLLNWNNTPGGFPIEDEDLHLLRLSTYILYNQQGSPWLFGGWVAADLATDFQHVDSDDFTFDVIAGAAYRFSDRLTVGLGVAALNLNADEEFWIGPAFDWQVNDYVRLGILGPNFIGTYKPDENWEFSLRGDASGEEWNIRDSAGKSTTLDLDTYRVGIYADRRLSGDLWFRVGTGFTVANEIEIKSPNGSRHYKDDLDEGWFGEIALRLKIW